MKYLGLLWLAASLSCELVHGATVTFNKDLAPIVYGHCAPCHHPDGVAPFPLLTYDDVRKHASQIVAVTSRRYMPPWPPEHGYGAFAGDRSLSAAQIHLFADWLKQSEPQGDPADLPALPHFTGSWQMGVPDLVLRMPKPFEMPADGTDIFRNFIVPTGLTTTKYVRGLELHLSNPRVVHHANVVLDHTESMRKRDGQDGRPGFPGMDVITEAAPDTFDPDSHFLFWKPASVLRLEPERMSWRLNPGTDLVLNLHLQPTGKQESVQVEIGLYFSAKPPSVFPMLLQLEHDGALHIPAGDPNFTVTDSLTLPVDVDLLAIYPHAHYLGKVIEAWATLPNGERRWLIRIPDWDINWQAEYEYKNPIALPKGTKLAMRIVYDNSSANPRNPNRPPKLVETGDRSQDEMGHVWFQVLPKTRSVKNEPATRSEAKMQGDEPATRSEAKMQGDEPATRSEAKMQGDEPATRSEAKMQGDEPATRSEAKIQRDPRLALQEAVMRRRLEKYPADFIAHYNLGALEQSRGELDRALADYRAALRIEPASATARNSLAAVLMNKDELPEAIEQLRAVLKNNPTYANARYNLARSLAASGDLDGAAAEYTAFLQTQPDDAQAEAALGTIYYKKHDFMNAIACFRKAAATGPADADVQANLGTLLALTGDLTSAEKAFEEALRLDPSHAAAQANLARVRAQLASVNHSR